MKGYIMTADLNNEEQHVFVSMQNAFELQLQSTEDWKRPITTEINRLVSQDFNKLLSILYRLDVSETKLKQTLKNNPGKDAGELIASLIIEREHEKFRSRSLFRKQDDVPGEEKW